MQWRIRDILILTLLFAAFTAGLTQGHHGVWFLFLGYSVFFAWKPFDVHTRTLIGLLLAIVLMIAKCILLTSGL